MEEIRRILRDSPFHGEGHRKVWARLRFAGTRTSRRRVLRLMRENALLAPARTGSPRGPRAHDGTIIHGRVFQTINEVRDAVRAFAALYHAQWIIKKNGYLSPSDARAARLDSTFSRAA